MIMITTKNPPNGRGCGKRDKEHPYLCCGMSPDGQPIEAFIIDPPRLWHRKFQRGYYILERAKTGVKDVLIFVGRQFYPSPWSYVEETRQFGSSRKIPRNFPFDQLTAGQSRMVFVHSKVIPEFEFCLEPPDRPLPLHAKCSFNWVDRDDWIFPGCHPTFEDDVTVCTFAHRDLAFLLHNENDMQYLDDKTFEVHMPSFSFVGNVPTWDGNADEEWSPGLFLALLITHIEYCQQEDEGSAQRAQEAGYQTIVLDY